jgi:hypothetical protein
MFWNKNKPPKNEDIQAVKTYYMKYDGKQGYVQVVGKVTKKFIAVFVNNPDFPSGKINRIMKVTKREFFQDFGGACTQMDIQATGFHLPQ